jgi:hypothetical protein
MSPAERERIASGSVEDWSREMWGKARDLAYQTLVGDPCGAAPVERPVMDEAKVRELIPAVRQDVVEGGIRLARLIDDALGPEAKAPGQKRS